MPVMKLAAFTQYFAQFVGFDPATVHVFAQGLRAGDLITKGGRGSAGAEMTQSDGTNLLLACLQQPAAREVADVVRGLRLLPLLDVFEGFNEGDGAARQFKKIPRARPLPLGFSCSTLGDALDGVIEAMLFDRQIVSWQQPGVAFNGGLSLSPWNSEFKLWIFFDNGSDFTMRYAPKTSSGKAPGIDQLKRINFETLKQIAKLLSIPSPDSTIAIVPRKDPAANATPAKPKPRNKK